MNEAGVKNNVKKRVPALRFPEFEGEWEERRLSQLGEVINGLTYSPSDVRSEGLLVLRSSNVKNGRLVYDDCVYVRKNINDANIALPGDIIICVRNGSVSLIGKNAIVGSDSPKCTHGAFMSSFRSEYKNFVFQQFQSDLFKRQVYIDLGARINSINSKQLEKYKFFFPKENSEQQKIAEFLSLVDEKIEKIEKKKQDFEKYKKGVIQKIFKQEIRFKDEDGKNFSDWKIKNLGKVLKERKEYSSKGKELEHVSLTVNGVVAKSKRYERDFLVRGDDKQYKITRLNDICYNPANLKFGVICRNKHGDGVFSPIYVTFEVFYESIEFMEYFLLRKDFVNQVRRYEEGTVYERMAVKAADFLKVKVSLPYLTEQRKIAEFLMSLDNKISALNQELTRARDFKKGLLQQMFI